MKPYVKTNKSDYIDAEAIAEAVGRPTMRFVPIKSDDQLDLQSLHRVRERWVMRRTRKLSAWTDNAQTGEVGLSTIGTQCRTDLQRMF